jgi:DNA-binding protein H-NS
LVVNNGEITMKIDLSKLNRTELEALAKDVEKSLQTLSKRELKAARDAAEKVARQFGYSLHEVLGTAPAKGAKAKAPAKYVNPDDPKQTWSGRGRRPAWITDGLAAGKALSDFEI